MVYKALFKMVHQQVFFGGISMLFGIIKEKNHVNDEKYQKFYEIGI